MTEIRSEDEVFRAFRLTQFEAQDLSDGQLLGAFLRVIVEMLSRDQSGAVVAHMRHQADMAEVMLRHHAPSGRRHPGGIPGAGIITASIRHLTTRRRRPATQRPRRTRRLRRVKRWTALSSTTATMSKYPSRQSGSWSRRGCGTRAAQATAPWRRIRYPYSRAQGGHPGARPAH